MIAVLKTVSYTNLALRSGAGLVQLMIPRELFPVAQVAVPEATCLPRTFPADLSRYDAVALGPGLGTCLLYTS